MVHTVWVFNGGKMNEGRPGDVFSNGAQGYIFSQMGFLGSDGAPPTQNGNNLMQGANVVGSVIKDGMGNVIGYESADHKSRAYNIDTSATMTQAWNAVVNGGTIHICKHGATGGGGITLDGGKMYDGFKPVGGSGNGTGVGNPGGPYELPPRPGANITMDCNGCNTSEMPTAGHDSVTGSAGTVPGVGTATGHMRKVYKAAGLSIGGPSQAAIDAAVAALDECAKKKGTVNSDGSGNGVEYIAKLPMKDQLSTAKACIAGTGGMVTISYAKTEQVNGNGCTDSTCYYEAIDGMGPAGGSIYYQATPQSNSIQLQVPPGSLNVLTPIFLTPTLIDTPLPFGTQPVTYPVSLSIYGSAAPPLMFNNPVFLHITYPVQDIVNGLYAVLPNGQLMQIPAQISGGMIQTQVIQGGTFVALGPDGSPFSGMACLGDGSGPVPCPCNNSGLAGHGCDNSIATGGATLIASGTTSPDTVVLTSSHELPSALSIFLQGTMLLPQPIPFGDGLRCVGGTLKRLYVKNAAFGVASAPGPGDPSITARSAALGDPIAPGTMRSYFVYYRDPSLTFCPAPQGNTWNDSPAGTIQW